MRIIQFSSVHAKHFADGQDAFLRILGEYACHLAEQENHPPFNRASSAFGPSFRRSDAKTLADIAHALFGILWRHTCHLAKCEKWIELSSHKI